MFVDKTLTNDKLANDKLANGYSPDQPHSCHCPRADTQTQALY